MSQATSHTCERIGDTLVIKCVDKQVFDSSLLYTLKEVFPAEPSLDTTDWINIGLVVSSLMLAGIGFWIAYRANKTAAEANTTAAKAIEIQSDQQYEGSFFQLFDRFDRYNLNIRFDIDEGRTEHGYNALKHLSKYISEHKGDLRVENHNDISSSQGLVIVKRYCLGVLNLADHIASNIFDDAQRSLTSSTKSRLKAVLKNSLSPFEIKIIATYCLAKKEPKSQDLMRRVLGFGLLEGIDQSLFAKEELEDFDLQAFGLRHKELEKYLKSDSSQQ